MKKRVTIILIIIIAIAIIIIAGFVIIKNSSNATQGLSSLCSNEEDCKIFCLNNQGRCEEYCIEGEDELCQIIFPFDISGEPESIKNENIREKEDCEGTKIKFDYPPVNLDETLVMLPRGLMTGDHVTPVNHHYFQNFDNQEYDIEVYSPGKGYITDIAHMPNAEEGKDYHITIRYTCTLWSYYIYVSNLPEKIKVYAPPKHGYKGVKIPVEAGELLGYYKNNLDFNLIDKEITLTGFAVPEHYELEAYKLHVVPDTYEYFNEPIKSKLIEKSIRTAEPISGKIDYDIYGKLVGNWFLEGTNGYAGKKPEQYWEGDLSFVYDYIDPERIVISIAGYDGEISQQFGVKGNDPDPAKISVEEGLVKYELISYDYITNGNSWDRKSLAKNLKTVPSENVMGVILVQLIDDRKIKFEAFPGKTAPQAKGFTSNMKIYER